MRTKHVCKNEGENVGEKPEVQLSSTALEAELLSDHIFVNIGKQLRSHFPGAVVVVNQRAAAAEIVHIRFLEGLGDFLDIIVNKVGRRFEDIDYKGDKVALEVMPSGKIYKLTGGFYQLALGEVSRGVASFIEKILQVNTIYSVGFVHNGNLMGMAVLIFRHKEDLLEEQKRELEKYAGECAVLIAKVNAMQRVLFLDDEVAIREMVKDLLSGEGFDVSVAASGKEALNFYRQKIRSGFKYHAVITDMSLRHGMNGVETAEEILRLDPKASLIFCTGNSTDRMLVEYKQYGYRGVLKKPFTIDDIKEAITTVTKQ